MAVKFFEGDRVAVRVTKTRSALIRRGAGFDWRGKSILDEKRTDFGRLVSQACLRNESGCVLAAHEKGGLVRSPAFGHHLYRTSEANDGFEGPRHSIKAR